MRIRGVGRIKIEAERILNRVRPGTVILLYHRVIELASDPLRLCVTPEHFAEHLDVISRSTRPLKLQQLSDSLTHRSVPKHGIVVTFDDGSKDNLDNAKPLLAQRDVPATVFVASGYTTSDCELWWDELDRLLLDPGDLPEHLSLRINGTTFEWQLSTATDNCNSRHDLYASLHKLLRGLSIAGRNDVINTLQEWSGKGAASRQSHEVLSPDNVVELAKDGLIEIGAHTVWHPVLGTLPVSEQELEIVQSKSDLEKITGQPVRSFAYPYGTLSDYTSETVDLVRSAGFECACSNYRGVVNNWAKRFELPRFVVQDSDGDTFERNLRSWFQE